MKQFLVLYSATPETIASFQNLSSEQQEQEMQEW